ncbi:DUF4352 domain-containing protein [Aureibacillus halotolerans]|uniref:Uncharacterized protein DUF4352 n=1 Tax=Aureibacillus halotolerans TaxID=1508390 RepID=A0A4R6UGE2_9BACI|nr:DUF4352 domain-containing protein [Aureibacillus halotolerans]TDQ42214.1 uncharacterized protein DUF4352 [Aureibacillus halotolerans]
MTIVKQINWKTIMAGTALSAMLVLSACSGGGEETTEEELSTDPGTTEDASTEVDETAEGNDGDEESTDDGDVSENSTDEDETGLSARGEGVTELSLGETGELETTLGTYNASVTNVEFVETIDDKEPDEGGRFLIADVTFENTSEQPLDSYEISRAWIINMDDESNFESRDYYTELDNFEGEIPPGETMQGQLAFLTTEGGENYQIQIGLEVYSNELLWNFTTAEAE